jgi:hypothetical protein
MTVLIDVETHSRLAAAAALSKCDRSTFAVSLIKRGLKGLVVIDRRKSVDPVEGDDRSDQQAVISPDEEEAA